MGEVPQAGHGDGDHEEWTVSRKDRGCVEEDHMCASEKKNVCSFTDGFCARSRDINGVNSGDG